jgi:hypothetical protein
MHCGTLSEDAACNRTVAVRACRRFPVILESLASGEISLTSVRLLHQHLTPENHHDILARAAGRSLRAIETLVAEIAPRPDVPTSVRKLPAPAMRSLVGMDDPAPGAPQPPPSVSCTPPVPPTHRPIIENTSPERYRVQFTIGKESHDRLRRLQELVRREIPTGDAGLIVERALALLLEKVESAKIGATKHPRPSPPIRSGTDRPTPSRQVARHDKRTAWSRDGAQCAFVAPDGRRCSERVFLEFHHVRPYALGGPGTADNISLRCRRHSQFEAEVVFGPRGTSVPERIEACETVRPRSAPR